MKKCVFGLLLGVIALFMTISPNFIAQAAEPETTAQQNIVKNVTFLAGDKPVKEGDTISLKDEFQFKYELESPLYMNYDEEDKEEGHVYLAKGDVVELPQLMNTAFDLSEIKDFELPLDNGTNFGTITVLPDGKVKLKINYSDNRNVRDVVVGVKFKLNPEVIGEETQYSFEIPGIEPKVITVNIEENDPQPEIPEEPVDVTKLTKDGGVFSEDGVASWEINLTNNDSFALKDVALYDYFKVGADFDIDNNSFVVKDNAGNALKEGKDYTKYGAGTTDTGQKYTWKLVLNNLLANETYTISYNTKINNFEKYIKENHAVPENHAWVEYNYAKEGEEPVFIKGTTVNKKGTGKDIATNAVVDKFLVSAEPAKHQLKWQIRVNKTYRSLTNVIVTEQAGDGQKIVSVENIRLKDPASKVTASDVQPEKISDGVYRLNFGDTLDGYSAIIDVVTELTEDEIKAWEADSNKKYYNTVSVECDQQDMITRAAYGYCKWKENVLDKTGKLDKVNKEINYSVAINGGKQILPEKLEIKDTLGASLTFVKDSVKLYIANVDSKTGNVTASETLAEGCKLDFSQEDGKEILVITLPEKADNNTAYVLSYSAKPKVIDKNGDYTNKVQLLGYGYESSQRDEYRLYYKSFGGGWIDDPTPKKPTPTPTPAPTPTPTPKPSTTPSSNNSGSSGSSSSSSSSAASDPNKVVGYGETVIYYGADGKQIASANNGTPNQDVIAAGANPEAKLAKTGGFVGTITSYTVGLVAMIGGAFLIFGKKKRNR